MSDSGAVAADISRSGTARGQGLLLLSALAFSTTGVFARLLPLDTWSTVFWRNLFGGLALLLLMLIRPARAGWLGRIGWRDAAMVACMALATLLYLAAFAYTTVANIAIIYAAAPMVTAAMAWVAFRETMSRRTLAASLLALGGVAMTMGGSLEAGTGRGDALALMMTLVASAGAVLARRATVPALAGSAASCLLASTSALPIGWLAGSSFVVSGGEAVWLAVFGTVSMALALPCYLAGIAEVPAGRAMLISAFELPLSPLWVWLAIGEQPGTASLIGGGIVALAIVADLRRPPKPV